MWKKKALTHCNGDEYGSYQDFFAAKESCEKDSNCAAIYDGSCNYDNFLLCQLGYTEKVSSKSCLYIYSARKSNYQNPWKWIYCNVIIVSDFSNRKLRKMTMNIKLTWVTRLITGLKHTGLLFWTIPFVIGM